MNLAMKNISPRGVINGTLDENTSTIVRIEVV